MRQIDGGVLLLSLSQSQCAFSHRKRAQRIVILLTAHGVDFNEFGITISVTLRFNQLGFGLTGLGFGLAKLRFIWFLFNFKKRFTGLYRLAFFEIELSQNTGNLSTHFNFFGTFRLPERIDPANSRGRHHCHRGHFNRRTLNGTFFIPAGTQQCTGCKTDNEYRLKRHS